VFSTDNTSNIPNLGTSQYNEARQITVTQHGVYNLKTVKKNVLKIVLFIVNINKDEK
jgi:hypothetical protein